MPKTHLRVVHENEVYVAARAGQSILKMISAVSHEPILIAV